MVPDRLAVFEDWSYKCFITVFFNLWIADVNVATEEAKSRVGFGCDVVDMFVPAQVVRYLDTKILGNVYMLARDIGQRHRMKTSTLPTSLAI